MLTEKKQAIRRAFREGFLNAARTTTSEVTHQRIETDRYAVCGVTVTRSGGGVRHCEHCARAVAKAVEK